MSPSERTQRARIAGLASAVADPHRLAPRRARAGLEARWQREAQERLPDGTQAQIDGLAASIRRLYYQRLSLAGHRAKAAR